MPHAAVELADGVNVNRTPALNQYGISASQLVRYQYDNSGAPMVQKMGGWARFVQGQTPAPARALWGWEDTNAQTHLAFGTSAYSGRTMLGVITNGVTQDITPTTTTTNASNVQFATTAGSPLVTVTDTTTQGVTSFDTVYLRTHVLIGGLNLFGLYPCRQVDQTHYQIMALDVLGNPLNAATTAPPPAAALATFDTSSGSALVTVHMANHGYVPGSTYSVLMPTQADGVTISGNYLVQQTPDINTFTILAQQVATSTVSGVPINGGNFNLLYSIGSGTMPPGAGFGDGGFGEGGFGTGVAPVVPASGPPINAHDWTLDNFGEALVGVPVGGTAPQFAPVYMWDPLSGVSQANIIPQAPPVNDGCFVAMPQRQIVCWGSTDTGIQDPLMVRWCDVNNPNVWVGTPTNQAGKFRLPRGSKIVGGIQGPQQALLWTDLAIWSMQYIGPPGVWGFNQIGTGCGLIGRKAAASANGVVYWMGPTQFFSLTAEGVQPLACPVWDVAFQDVDPNELMKIRVAVNSRFNEIMWFIPTLQSGGEISTYLKFNYALGWWDYGLMARSAWIDQSVLGAPIGADPDSRLIFQHEISNNADGVPMQTSFSSGYFTLAEGDQMIFLDEVWPDARYGEYNQPQNCTLQIQFNVADFPEQPPRVYGPYNCTQASTWFNTRARGRLFSFDLMSNDPDSFWRLGRFRYRAQPAGRYG